MKRLLTALASLTIVFGGPAGPAAPAAAEAAQSTSCCWLYCETYRDVCFWSFREDREYCDAWYQGCIEGCQYGMSPESAAF